jgi:CheY-like chemotaxis protein
MMTETEKYILIVDDNEDAQQILGKVLTSAGYRTAAAGDGRDAELRIEAETPDLILLDLMMPRMSGFELLTRLRANVLLREIPVVVMSAYLSTGNDDILTLQGVTRILPKASFRIPVLLSTIGELVNRSSATSTAAA